MLSLFFVGNRLEDFPSPKLLPVLESATPSQAFEQTIDQALIQSLVQTAGDATRSPQLLVSTAGWYASLATAPSKSPGRWYTANVRWLYKEWPAIHGATVLLRVGEADWLCHVTYGGTPLIANRLLSDDCGDSDPAHLMQDMPFPPRAASRSGDDTEYPHLSGTVGASLATVGYSRLNCRLCGNNLRPSVRYRCCYRPCPSTILGDADPRRLRYDLRWRSSRPVRHAYLEK